MEENLNTNGELYTEQSIIKNEISNSTSACSLSDKAELKQCIAELKQIVDDTKQFISEMRNNIRTNDEKIIILMKKAAEESEKRNVQSSKYKYSFYTIGAIVCGTAFLIYANVCICNILE